MSRLVLGLYLAALFLLPWSWFPPFPWLHPSAQWSDAVFAVAAAAWALDRAVRRERPRLAPAHVAMLAYLGWAVVSHAAHGFAPRIGGFKLLGLAELVTLAVVTGDVVSRPGGTKAIGWTVALASLLMGASAVAGFGLYYAGLPTPLLSGPGDLEPGSYARVRAGFPLPNLLASFCIFAWGVVSHDEARLPRGLRRLAQAAVGAAALLTFARPILGLVLAELVRRADRPGRRRLAWALAVAAAVAVASLTVWNVGLNPTRPWEAHLRAEPSSRRLSVTSSWRSVVRAPLFGVGPGSLPGERWGFGSDAHFTPLDVAGTLGLPALVAFAAIPLLLWRGRRRPTDLAVWGVLAGLALDALANDVEDFRHLWVAFGLAGARARPAAAGPRNTT